MINNPRGKIKPDGFSTLDGGQDSGRAPSLIKPNQCSFAINARFRGAFPRPRPGFKRIALTFPDTLTETRFKTGRFQCSAFFDPDSGSSVLVASIGGRLFRLNVDDDNSVQEITISHSVATTADFTAPAENLNNPIFVTDTANISINSTVYIGDYQFLVVSVQSATQLIVKNINAPAGTVIPTGTLLTFWDPNPAKITKAWMCQAEKWLIVRDGQSVPIIYNGATARRAYKDEIKPGRAMAYGMGRVWGALTDERSFRAGDLVFGSSGTAQEGFRDAVLKETENDFLKGGGNFTTPANSGGIKFLRFVANLDTSLGQGPLQVGTPNQIFSVRAPLDRTEWQNLQNPIQTISLISYGALGHENSILVNGDLIYRAIDGIRSFILARREFGSWSNTPMSREMSRVLDKDDQWLLEYGSAVVFDNRLLMTCSPVFTHHGVYHRGLVALDFDLISGINDKAPPAYDGLWTGLNFIQLVKGDFRQGERCFAFHLNQSSEIELYEVTRNDRFDDGEIHIPWVLESRSFNFGSSYELKKLAGGDLWVDELTGSVDFEILYRPDQHPCWQEWHSWTECANYRECGAVDPLTGCQTIKNFREQFRPRMALPTPADTPDPLTNRNFRDGYEFQLRIEITGYCRLKQVRIKSQEIQEEPFPGAA